MQPEIYLDANATSPVLPAAIDAAVRACRLLGVGAGRLTFTSGATEGIQTAVLSALCAVRERRAAGDRVGDLLLYGATEHKAVSESLAHWNALLGTNLTIKALPV